MRASRNKATNEQKKQNKERRARRKTKKEKKKREKSQHRVLIQPVFSVRKQHDEEEAERPAARKCEQDDD